MTITIHVTKIKELECKLAETEKDLADCKCKKEQLENDLAECQKVCAGQVIVIRKCQEDLDDERCQKNSLQETLKLKDKDLCACTATLRVLDNKSSDIAVKADQTKEITSKMHGYVGEYFDKHKIDCDCSCTHQGTP